MKTVQMMLVCIFIIPFSIPLRAEPMALQVKEGHPNVVWKAILGRQSGQPLVTERYVIVCGDSAELNESRAVVRCFDRVSGKLMWSSHHERLHNRIQDLGLGLVTQPATDKQRVFYMNNRSEVIAERIDPDLKSSKPKREWSIDLAKKHQVFFRASPDFCTPIPAPIYHQGVLYCATGNGSNFGLTQISPADPFVRAPNAPSLVAIDAAAGKLLWEWAVPKGNVFFGQWSSPVHVQSKNIDAIAYAAGDGCLYLLDRKSGKQVASEVLDPLAKKPWGFGSMGDELFSYGKPFVSEERIFIGQHRGIQMPSRNEECKGAVVSLNLAKLVAGKKSIEWTFKKDIFEGVLGDIVVTDDLLFAVSDSGTIVCLDIHSGFLHWCIRNRSGGSEICPSVVLKNRHIYVPISDELVVYEASKRPIVNARYQFPSDVQSAVAFDDKHIFVSTYGALWCIRASK